MRAPKERPPDTPNVADALMGLEGLPALPSVMTRILATVADPDASALDLSPYISADQSLAATLLRIVNSAYYGRYRRVASITSAIVMLGFQEVRNIALAATAFQVFPRSRSGYDRNQLWRHSLATAMAAERVARMADLSGEGCFEAGLLHDIGKVVFDLLYPERFAQAVSEAHAREMFIREIEPVYFGMNHAAAGERLARHWDLPETVASAIGGHHADRMAGARSAALPEIVAIADFAVYQANLGENSNGRQPAGAPGDMTLLTVRQWDALVQELADIRPRIDGFLGTLP
ncbi:MAG TPA: HDOD domain-containing protein [Candidatus Hydrogenedentes bacterium]|nr:HDOD domain-containing protein [Candidatus Hydrogenedentota bacterium]HRT19284.1 HDOD domain-containing protein [Candidatus Hydrogenedentota bacterium]HRT63364.1 HDOD domain-containing protein [Candidatus Hydrogenedentota bacterium]